mgnify:CR=1 FL=1
MSKLESILAGIVGVGLASSTLLLFSPVARENVMAMMPKSQPDKVVKAPDDIIIRSDTGTEIKATVDNVICGNPPGWAFTQYRCTMYGVETDLTGKQAHFSQSDMHCGQDYHGMERNEDYNTIACVAGRMLGKSPTIN